MPIGEIEEVRLRSGGSLTLGQWNLPPSTAPHPMVLLPPWKPGKGRFGTAPSDPDLHPHLPLIRALVCAGMATFSCDAQATESSEFALCGAAWKVAVNHPLVSRSRVGIIGLEAGCTHLIDHLADYARVRLPMAAVLVAPDPAITTPIDAGTIIEVIESGIEHATTVAATCARVLRPAWSMPDQY